MKQTTEQEFKMTSMFKKTALATIIVLSGAASAFAFTNEVHPGDQTDRYKVAIDVVQSAATGHLEIHDWGNGKPGVLLASMKVDEGYTHGLSIAVPESANEEVVVMLFEGTSTTPAAQEIVSLKMANLIKK